jgi:pantoate kinase
MLNARAFAPANGSLIFETYEATSGHGRGSLGVGFTLEVGVVSVVTRSARTQIFIGAEEWEFPTVRQVVRDLAPSPVRVEIAADLPFGCGFGMSGASALATAYAIGRLFHLPGDLRPLAMVAHEAEVDNRTGRGDVGGQFNGGFMMKAKIGAPLEVEWLPIEDATVWCRIFGPILTSEVLGDAATMARVNAAGHAALDRLRARPDIDLDGLLFLSREFAEESGLLTSRAVREAIAEAEKAGGHASMVMLGEAVVSSVPIGGARAYRVLKNPARVL